MSRQFIYDFYTGLLSTKELGPHQTVAYQRILEIIENATSAEEAAKLLQAEVMAHEYDTTNITWHIDQQERFELALSMVKEN